MTTIIYGQTISPFKFNSLLMIVDQKGIDTGSRCRFIGLSADCEGRITGEAHVTLLDRHHFWRMGNVNIAMHLLRQV